MRTFSKVILVELGEASAGSSVAIGSPLPLILNAASS